MLLNNLLFEKINGFACMPMKMHSLPNLFNSGLSNSVNAKSTNDIIQPKSTLVECKSNSEDLKPN